MQDKCRNCGGERVVLSNEGDRLSRIDIQFCSEQCKNEFHNSIRKARRKIASIEKSLQELDAIYQKYSHHSEFNFIVEARNHFDLS
jgi:predicted translin family RNA/ssDNA-binding protein